MKVLKRNSHKLAFFLTTVFLFGLFESCSKSQEISETIGAIETYSGEDIFRGMFFLSGGFVDEIPSLKQLKVRSETIFENPTMLATAKSNGLHSKAEIEDQMEDFWEKIIGDVKQIDPSIFEDLKSSILKGDVDNLDESVKHAAGVLNTALIKNEEVLSGVKLVDQAFNEKGIDPNDYDLTTADGIDKYNKKIMEFAKSKDYKGKASPEEEAGVVFIFLVVAYFLVAVGAYLVVAIGGGVLFFIGGLYLIEIYADWGTGQDEVGIDTAKGTLDDLGYKMILADLINFANENQQK